uniref:Cadherin domain-containing protein n=1 Tax=Timema shepardi TaxID=629360 RepID=A0A7R9AM67_TIMSH|nr:unnamed protein product [Timema shepardi]
MFCPVFVAVENENDNTPLTEEPVYYTSIPENSSSGKVVAHLRADDHDRDPDQRLSYRITAGNPESFFSIDSDTEIRALCRCSPSLVDKPLFTTAKRDGCVLECRGIQYSLFPCVQPFGFPSNGDQRDELL